MTITPIAIKLAGEIRDIFDDFTAPEDLWANKFMSLVQTAIDSVTTELKQQLTEKDARIKELEGMLVISNRARDEFREAQTWFNDADKKKSDELDSLRASLAEKEQILQNEIEDNCDFEDRLIKILNVRPRKSDCDSTDDLRIEERCMEVMESLVDKEKKVMELRDWKESALEVMPDYQEIGKLLGVQLGLSVHDKIVLGITALLKDKERLTAFQNVLRHLETERDSFVHENQIQDPETGAMEGGTRSQREWLDEREELIERFDAARTKEGE